MNSTESNNVRQALKIKRYWDSLRIGYNGSEDCRCVTGPKPFEISPLDNKNLLDYGEALRQWLLICIRLCTKAYTDSTLSWLTTVVEGNVDTEAIELHRTAHKAEEVHLPCLFRPDMPNLSQAIEVQIPGSGWGYMTAIHNIVPNGSSYYGPVIGFGKAMEVATGLAHPRGAYILYNPPLKREVDFFAKSCKEQGVNLNVFFKKVPVSDNIDFVRRPPLEDLLEYEGSASLVKACLDHKIYMDPGLSLLFDQKVATAFPFDHRLREFFPDLSRTLFPETYLIQDQVTPIFGGEKFSWEEIAQLSRTKRHFIVKFGGAKKGLRAGGKAVFNLGDLNQDRAKEVIQSALSDWRRNKAQWIIQERIKEKFSTTFLDPSTQEIRTMPYYAIFRPMFLWNEDEIKIIANSVLLRKEWKVHGSSDAVNLPVEVS